MTDQVTFSITTLPAEFVTFWNESSLPDQVVIGFFTIHIFLLLLNVVAVGYPLKRHYKKPVLLHAIRLVSIVCSERMLHLYFPGETKTSLHRRLNRFQLILCYYLYGVGILFLWTLILFGFFLLARSLFGGGH